MESKDYEIEPLHYTKLSVAIIESLNKKHPVTFYVKENKKYTIVNGMILTIVEGNGNKYPLTEEYENRNNNVQSYQRTKETD